MEIIQKPARLLRTVSRREKVRPEVEGLAWAKRLSSVQGRIYRVSGKVVPGREKYLEQASHPQVIEYLEHVFSAVKNSQGRHPDRS